MRTASITETKNRLSALLDLVRHGEEVLILDRGVPVARLVPPIGGGSSDEDEARLARLERQGLIRRGTGVVPKWIFETPPPVGPGELDILEALLEERREGR